MLWVARIAGSLVFLFSLAMGMTTLVDPARMAETLGLAPLTEMGRNTVRADISAFFLVGAIACAGGLFRGRSGLFLVPALLFGIAVSGRLIDAAMAGAPEGLAPSVVIELIMVTLSLVAAKWSARQA